MLGIGLPVDLLRMLINESNTSRAEGDSNVSEMIINLYEAKQNKHGLSSY